jgi:hypothetical protein
VSKASTIAVANAIQSRISSLPDHYLSPRKLARPVYRSCMRRAKN